MSFRWSEETTLKFVLKYLEHECLWNIKSPHYKNKQMKQSAYMDLECTMNIPGFGEKEIKLKIKAIRSTYSQELKKIKDSKNSSDATDIVYIPSVKWFSILDKSLRNINSILSEGESNLGTAPNLPNAGAHPTSSYTALSRKRRLLHGLPGAQDLLTKATQYLEMEDDECLTLAKGYATKLRKLSPKQLMYVDKVINEALFDAQMGRMTPDSHLIHSEVLRRDQTDKVL